MAPSLSSFAVLALALSSCVLDAGTTEDFSHPPVGARLDDLPDGDSLDRDFPEDEPLPARLSLVDRLTPVRNQADRNTCNPFAAVGLMEYLYMKEHGWTAPDFSEQYVQWLLKGQGFDPWPDAETSNPYYALQAIHEHGIPTESFWPYAPSLPTGAPCDAEDKPGVPCYTAGLPPGGTPELWTLPSEPRWIHPDDIKSHMLHEDIPVVVSLKWRWQAWSHGGSELPVNSEYQRLGIIPYPNAADNEQSERRPGGHTVLVVGWDDELELPTLDEEGYPTGESERGFYIFKNSWGGEGWGRDNPHGAGLGLVSQRYLSELGSAIVVDVPE